MELLAPAGSLAAFEAALAEGADAVYVGAPALSARVMAREFSFSEIGAMIDEAHRRGRKLYIAMNSLVKEGEVPQVVEALSLFSRLGPDALIIQDLGVLRLAQRFFPDLSLHASTLMSVHNSLAARHLVELGCEQVVLARELTLDEIGEIGRRSGAELEIFVHGAMCFSYSGLCLFSSLHGGRSSLRGQCVQPCRRRYSWAKGRSGGGRKGRGPAPGRGGYLFSMNDLCGIDLLSSMRDAGVRSLKIEGRLRAVEYVRRTVRAYRLVLDSLDRPEPERRKAEVEAGRILDQAMGRRRSTGYFLDSRPAGAVTPAISGNTGTMVGRVERLERRGAASLLHVRLREAVSVGDRLRLHIEQSDERQPFSLRLLRVGGRNVDRARAGQKVVMEMPGRTGTGGRGGLQGVLFRVDVHTRDRGERPGRGLAARVKRYRVTPDRALVEEILEELRWRPFSAARAPEKRQRPQGRGRKKERQHSRSIRWWVRIRSVRTPGRRLPVRPARILVPLDRENTDIVLAGKERRHGGARRLVWCLPPVIQEAELSWFLERIARLREAGFGEFQLGHISQRGLFGHAEGRGDDGPELRLYGDYTLNVLNSQSLAACRDLGLAAVQFSLETDRETLVAALAGFRAAAVHGQRSKGGREMKVGILVYGRPPLFTARLQADHLRQHQALASPRGERFVLDHEQGLTHARAELPFSLLGLREELLRAGLDYLVLDLGGGPRELDTLATLLRGTGRQPAVLSGNYDGVLV